MHDHRAQWGWGGRLACEHHNFNIFTGPSPIFFFFRLVSADVILAQRVILGWVIEFLITLNGSFKICLSAAV
jgi:hypothetical protein